MLKKISKITAAACVVAAASTLWAGSPGVPKLTPDQKLRYAEAIIENYYVDSVNADSIVTEAIVAMLKTLDPHSAYSNADETRELNQPLEGKFSGIGVQFSIVRDTVCVVQTIQGGPSQRMGIAPGDRIIYVNDTLFTRPKMQNSDVLKTLRGPKGSQVNLKIKRVGEPGLIDFRIIRDDIPIHSIDNAYMVTPEVGFIQISRFAEDTPAEVDRAIAGLRKKGMRHLIIDLEDNGGGYLGAAYQLSERFLKPGDLVVYTQGLNVPPQHLVAEQPHDTGVDRLVIMTNQFSASASEIFSGAMQDHDRGLVVGRRTFGKRLVQRPFPFPDGSMIRLTTSRYYTPAGRSIQKPYAKGQTEEYQLDLLNRAKHGELFSADSIKFDQTKKYRTLRNGRTVYGGGGIMPDAFVPVDTTLYSKYYRDLVAKGIINRFVTEWLDQNRKDALAQYADADAFADGFDATQLVPRLAAMAVKTDSVAADSTDLQKAYPLISAVLKGLLERDLYRDGSYMRSVNPLNPVFNRALQLITDPEEYYRLLGRTRPAGH